MMCEGKYNPIKYLCDFLFCCCNQIGKGSAPAQYSTTQVLGTHQPKPQKMMSVNPPTNMRGEVEGKMEDRVVR